MSSDKRSSIVFSWNKTAANETKWYSVRNRERNGLLRVDYITWYRHKRGYDTTKITG